MSFISSSSAATLFWSGSSSIAGTLASSQGTMHRQCSLASLSTCFFWNIGINEFFQDLPQMGCLRVIKTYHSGLNGKRLTTTWLKARYEKSNRHTVLLDLSLLDLLMVEADEGQEELR